MYRKHDSELYEHLEGLTFSGATEVEVDGQTNNAARDKDERGDEFFILTPVGRHEHGATRGAHGQQA